VPGELGDDGGCQNRRMSCREYVFSIYERAFPLSPASPSLSLFLEESAGTRCHPSYALLGGDSKGVRKGGGRRESDECSVSRIRVTRSIGN